jgi:hypothetical protein
LGFLKAGPRRGKKHPDLVKKYRLLANMEGKGYPGDLYLSYERCE